ncbi:hypothetical protein QJS66_21125 [Kocuria rhizophila]|nr:hypothetical protein QJS66_21125 [Kocuria rhizophila]
MSKHLSFLAQCGAHPFPPRGSGATWYSHAPPRAGGTHRGGQQPLGATGPARCCARNLHHPPPTRSPSRTATPPGPFRELGHGRPLTGAAAAPTTPRQESL